MTQEHIVCKTCHGGGTYLGTFMVIQVWEPHRKDALNIEMWPTKQSL